MRSFFNITVTLLTRVAFLFFCVLSGAQGAHANDIRAVNIFPTTNSTYYSSDTITFLGAVENLLQTPVGEAGYADLIIDYGRDGLGLESRNANPDTFNPNDPMGYLGGGAQKSLEESVSNLPVGNHRFQFSVDTHEQSGDINLANNSSSWVNFSIVAPPVAPTITLTATQNPINVGNSTTLTWTVADATSCTASGGWSGSKAHASNATHTESVSPAVTTLYRLDCTGSGGTASKEFTVNVIHPAPSVSISATPNSTPGGSASLSWNTSNATACTASGAWSGARALSGSLSVSPTSTVTYILTCFGLGGTTTRSQVVTVNLPLPVITLSAVPTSVAPGGTTTISWSVTNATHCIGSNGSGSFPTTSGWNAPKNPVSGSIQVGSLIARTYILNCSNPTAGTSTSQVSVSLTGLPNLTTAVWAHGQRINTSIGSTSANPLVVNQPNTLRAQARNTGAVTTGIGFSNRFYGNWGWTVTENIGYTSSPALAAGQTNTPYDEIAFTPTKVGHLEIGFCTDSHAVLPSSRIAETNESSTDNSTWRQFAVASSGPGFPSLDFSTIGVTPSSVSAIVDRALGATSTLTWTVEGATSCEGDGDDPLWLGPKNPAGGSFEANPIISAVNGFADYMLTCTGPAGEVVETIRIRVATVQPTVTLTATPASLPAGSSTVLTWTVTNANTCTALSIPTDIHWNGQVGRNGGSTTFVPTEDTLYRITCQSPNGSTIQEVSINVTEPPPVITLQASNNPITPIDTTSLEWTVSGAVSCTASSDPVTPDWTGAKTATNGTHTQNDIAPDVTTTYYLSCTSPGGSSDVAEITISVGATPPILESLTKSADVIIEGNEAILTWSVLGAETCKIGSAEDPENASTSVPVEGTLAVSPEVSAMYTLTCTGPWGNSPPWTTQLNVIERAMISVFKICDDDTLGTTNCPTSLSDVYPGSTKYIHWTATKAASCNAVSGYSFNTGSALSGILPITITPTPNRTDTYVISCATGGYTTASQSIEVETQETTPNISVAQRVVDDRGNVSVEVRWDTNNTDQRACTIRGGGVDWADVMNTKYNGALTDLAKEEGTHTVDIYGRTKFTIQCGENNPKDEVTVELSPRIWGI